MQGEVKDFADKYDCRPGRFEKKKECIISRILKEEKLLMAYFMDFDDEYPVHTNVISNFIKNYYNMDAELLLCYDIRNERAQMQRIN